MFFNNKFNTFFGLNLTLVYTFPMCMTWRFHFPLRNYDFKKAVVKRSINFEDYKTCLFTGKPQTRTMNVIRSHRHELFTEEINKIALSVNDDKRVILEDGIHTLAHGHWRTY